MIKVPRSDVKLESVCVIQGLKLWTLKAVFSIWSFPYLGENAMYIINSVRKYSKYWSQSFPIQWGEVRSEFMLVIVISVSREGWIFLTGRHYSSISIGWSIEFQLILQFQFECLAVCDFLVLSPFSSLLNYIRRFKFSEVNLWVQLKMK